MKKLARYIACWLAIGYAGVAHADTLSHVIALAKPSIVGIATMKKMRSPAVIFLGTGFAIKDGLTVLTSAHIVQAIKNGDPDDILGILVGMGETAQFRTASVLVFDKEHDLAQLRISGSALPAMQMGDSDKVEEGQSLAFTGFPLGMALGLHQVTHRATVSAITPVVMPAMNSRQLDAKVITQIHQTLFSVFQLDATAYPGNSGSPLYDPETGLVYGVISMVLVKSLKENVISSPSGITYAIPGNFIGKSAQPK